MSFTYTVSGGCDHYDFETIWDIYDLDYVAEDAASDYHHNHDGWESNWPVDIEVFQEGESLGKFSVDREYDPMFKASRIEQES